MQFPRTNQYVYQVGRLRRSSHILLYAASTTARVEGNIDPKIIEKRIASGATERLTLYATLHLHTGPYHGPKAVEPTMY